MAQTDGIEWGGNDCASVAMDHAERLLGRALSGRPHFLSEGEAEIIKADQGGLAQAASLVLCPDGFEIVGGEPRKEDIVLVDLGAQGEAFAIMGERMLRFEHPGGLSLLKLHHATVIGVWRLSCPT